MTVKKAHIPQADDEPREYPFLRQPQHSSSCPIKMINITPELQVKCFIEPNHRGRQSIGSYSLSDNGEISNIIVTDKKQEEWIVTTSGIDPQVFSKKGSSFYFNISSK